MDGVLDYEEDASVAKLREDLRFLIREHVPTDFLGAFTDDSADFEVAQLFCKVLSEQNLLSLAWPKIYGGLDASVWEQAALREEMWAHHEPRGAQYMGLNWVGPALMAFGTPEQRKEHLGRISNGDVIWCQGFSEPEAGSDLASLTTSATRDGDGWRIYGQKIWTSYALMAQWCFLLARTNSDGDKHDGITVFLVEMDQPGIEVRPISTMLGPHHLNEVFFDGAWVGPEGLLGQSGKGWEIVMSTLAFERVGIARYARCERLLNLAPIILGALWDLLPLALRHRWVCTLVHARQARLLAYQVIALQELGSVSIGDAAAYRIAVTQLDQESADVLMEILEMCDVSSSSEIDHYFREVEDHWRYAQASTVASGSLEMQRIALAREIVGRR